MYRIIDIRYDSIALGKVKHWQRPFFVYADDWAVQRSIWICCRPSDIPIEGMGDSECSDHVM